MELYYPEFILNRFCRYCIIHQWSRVEWLLLNDSLSHTDVDSLKTVLFLAIFGLIKFISKL